MLMSCSAFIISMSLMNVESFFECIFIFECTFYLVYFVIHVLSKWWCLQNIFVCLIIWTALSLHLWGTFFMAVSSYVFLTCLFLFPCLVLAIQPCMLCNPDSKNLNLKNLKNLKFKSKFKNVTQNLNLVYVYCWFFTIPFQSSITSVDRFCSSYVTCNVINMSASLWFFSTVKIVNLECKIHTGSD